MVGNVKKFFFDKGVTTIWRGQQNLNLFGKIHYAIIIVKAYKAVWAFYRRAIKTKECYYGPFKGEFGHFLLHNLPFLSHLYRQGVKIHYCGMGLHKPFLIDEAGKSIIHSFDELRDFFSEVSPSSNRTIPPEDVRLKINAFRSKAEMSGMPFLDIDDTNLYWYVFRNWQLYRKKQHVFNLSKIYKTRDENAAVIFPRKKGGAVTPNNGGPWDYMKLARSISPYFDRVYITGHPSLSENLHSEANIEVCLSTNNEVILQKCSNSKLIITQHSGAIHIGVYTDTPVLLIFNGKLPIAGLSDTFRFRKNFISNREINFAFSENEVIEFVKTI